MMYISKALITEDREIERYSKEELIDAHEMETP